MSSRTPLNVGRIDFINTTPVYAGADQGRLVFPGKTVRGTPAELNAMLRAGRLQISSVSSVEFARSWPDLLILPGISISCTGPVRSVLLHSKTPAQEIAGKVGVSNRSATARALVRVILEDFLHRSPEFSDVNMDAPEIQEAIAHCRGGNNSEVQRSTAAIFGDLDGLLVIGDDALSLDLQGIFPHVLDLGEFWVDRTGLPFVFGIWAVRKDFALEHPLEVESFRSCLLRSLGYGLRETDTAIELARANTGFSAERIRSYLERIDYVLGPEHIHGLNHFFDLLKRRNEIDPAVELEFYERQRERSGHE